MKIIGNLGCVCCCLHCIIENVNVEAISSVLGQSWMVVYTYKCYPVRFVFPL